MHNIPSTPEQTAEHNYQRGFISCCERILDLAKDWQEWKESHKK